MGSNTVTDLTFFVDLDSPITLPAVATEGNGTTIYSLTPVLPAALTYATDTRVISGVPTGGPQSATVFTYTATDRDGDAVEQTFSVTVYPRIAIPSIGVQNISANRQITIALPTASGGSGSYSYDVPDLPPGLSFDSSSGTPQFFGIPTTIGETTLTYTVRDNIPPEEASLIFTIVVEEDLQPEFESDQMVDDLIFVLRDSVSLTLSGATGGNGPITYSLSSGVLPAGLIFSAPAQTIEGMPTTVAAATEITYRATDRDGDLFEQTFTITVIPSDLGYSNPSGWKQQRE